MDLVEFTNFGPNKEEEKLKQIRDKLNCIRKDTLQHGMARLNALEEEYAQQMRITELIDKFEMSQYNYCFTLKVSSIMLVFE